MLAQRDRTRIGCVARNLATRRITLEGQQRFDLGVPGKCLRTRQVDGAARAIDTIGTLLRALNGTMHVVDVLKQEISSVDEVFAIVFGDDRKRSQYRCCK